MEGLVDLVNGIIWSPALVYLCLGAGLFYSIMTRFVQVRLFGEMITLLFTLMSKQPLHRFIKKKTSSLANTAAVQLTILSAPLVNAGMAFFLPSRLS